MTKTTQRTVFFGAQFLIFLFVAFIVIKLGVSLFLAFVIACILALVFMYNFLKLPIRCDQEGCDGNAQLETSSELNNTFLKRILADGHRCPKCNHLIKLPKNRAR